MVRDIICLIYMSENNEFMDTKTQKLVRKAGFSWSTETICTKSRRY